MTWWEDKAITKMAVSHGAVAIDTYPNCADWAVLINVGGHMVRDASGTAVFTLPQARKLLADLQTALAEAEKEMPDG